MRLIELFWKNERGTMVADIAKAGAAIAFLSVVAANFVSSRTTNLDQERLGQVASAASRGQAIDPLVTGSILKRANETKLDPCVVQR
ncbi:hypothetical protein [Bosea sp. PAMC 26642]|uniref:hypothetical protein n=1 Tax=Bosea sp. (strain PAMC 26642) TaxID=1792307 RepID=UPI0007704E48|nr:hypothetical protein [Bosea sp. PAMC 26642]AMJ60183.1 hypothetical protein AXW83_07630 [Bosea sp. PAMC 26642]